MGQFLDDAPRGKFLDEPYVPPGAVAGSPGTRPDAPSWAVPFVGQPQTSGREAAGRLTEAAGMTATSGIAGLPGVLARTAATTGGGAVAAGAPEAATRGGLNLVLEALPPTIGKLLRAIREPGLIRRVAAEHQAAQTASDVAFKSGEAARKAGAEESAAKSTASALQDWMLRKRGLSEAYDVEKRARAGQSLLNRRASESAAQQANVSTGEAVRDVAARQVPSTPLRTGKEFQDFAWGEQGMARVKQVLNDGQEEVVRNLGGQNVSVPFIARRRGAESPEMPFPDAWREASRLKGQARDDAIDELRAAVADKSDLAAETFAKLQDTYKIAMAWRAAGRHGAVEPSGGAYGSKALTDWWNKNRDVMHRRMGPERYGEAERALFGGRGAGSARPDVPAYTELPSPPKPGMPPKPAPTQSSFTPGERPVVSPRTTAEQTGIAVPFLHHAGRGAGVPYPYMVSVPLLGRLLTKWRGDVPYKPSPALRALFSTAGQEGRRQLENE